MRQKCFHDTCVIFLYMDVCEEPPHESVQTFSRSPYKLMHRTELTRGNNECWQIFQKLAGHGRPPHHREDQKKNPHKNPTKWNSNRQWVTSNQPVTAVSQHSQLCSSELFRSQKVTLRGRFKLDQGGWLSWLHFSFLTGASGQRASDSAGGNAALSSPADHPEHSDVEPSGTEGAVTQQINGDASSGSCGRPSNPSVQELKVLWRLWHLQGGSSWSKSRWMAPAAPPRWKTFPLSRFLSCYLIYVTLSHSQSRLSKVKVVFTCRFFLPTFLYLIYATTKKKNLSVKLQ